MPSPLFALMVNVDGTCHRVIDSASTDIGGRFDDAEGDAVSYASTMGIVEVR